MNKPNTLKDYITFTINPNNEPIGSLSVTRRLFETLKIFVITFVALFIAGILIYILEKTTGTKDFDQSIIKYSFKSIKQHSNFALFFFIGFAVFIEELMFRLPLTKYNRKFIQFSLSLIMASLLMRIIEFQNLFSFPSLFQYLIVYYLTQLILAGLIYLILKKQWPFDFSENWAKCFPIVFYSVTILFAVGHMPFGNLSVMQYIFSPILLLPYIIMGISFGYLRVKHGFAYSVVLHISINLLANVEIFLN